LANNLPLVDYYAAAFLAFMFYAYWFVKWPGFDFAPLKREF
jgi:hypothetical protein